MLDFLHAEIDDSRTVTSQVAHPARLSAEVSLMSKAVEVVAGHSGGNIEIGSYSAGQSLFHRGVAGQAKIEAPEFD